MYDIYQRSLDIVLLGSNVKSDHPTPLPASQHCPIFHFKEIHHNCWQSQILFLSDLPGDAARL